MPKPALPAKKRRRYRLNHTCPACGSVDAMTRANRDYIVMRYGGKCSVCRKAELSRALAKRPPSQPRMVEYAPAPCGQMESAARGRCSGLLTCNHYGDCLDIAIMRGWGGWRETR